MASAATLAGGALTTMAFPAGIPSDRATESETTASTPPIPTVPNAITGRRSDWVPVTVTPPPSGSRSSVPIVQDTAMPPSATPCHRRSEAAVGLAAYSRNVEGLTPSTAVYAPLIWTLAASTGSVPVTPGSRDTAARICVDRENGATTSRSGWRNSPSGATDGGAGVPAPAAGAVGVAEAPAQQRQHRRRAIRGRRPRGRDQGRLPRRAHRLATGGGQDHARRYPAHRQHADQDGDQES